jgi:hypothetical protein
MPEVPEDGSTRAISEASHSKGVRSIRLKYYRDKTKVECAESVLGFPRERGAQVLDGNCTDADGCTIEVPSDPLGDLCYDVYATGLGKPNAGQVIVNASCTIDGLIGSCADALLLDTFTVDRPKGKPRRQNISDVFRASGCVDLGGVEGVCDTGDLQFNNVWIFNIPQLLEYFWDYTNTGLRLMQVRFYPTTCGSFTTVP